MLRYLKRFLFSKGITVSRNRSKTNSSPVELDASDLEIINYVRAANLSMGSYDNLYTTALACKHVIEMEIEGDFVECGVYRGGHSIIAAEIFNRYGVEKKVYLFDTFKGMTEPTSNDFSLGSGLPARIKYNNRKYKDHVDWAYCSLIEVKKNFIDAKLMHNNIIFVEGDVLQTIPSKVNSPASISFLRLDTDWYESTKIELEFFYPILSKNGILVVDDYGSWAGSRKATEEYFTNKHKPFLSLIEGGARVGIKI